MPHLSHDAMQFAYSPAGKPLLPLTLTLGGESVVVEGLLDSGADVNVLPWSAGQTLRAACSKEKGKGKGVKQRKRGSKEKGVGRIFSHFLANGSLISLSVEGENSKIILLTPFPFFPISHLTPFPPTGRSKTGRPKPGP